MASVRLIAFALCALTAAPAFANDSTAALGAGGINLVRNTEIDLLSEDLFVSAREIRVTYHFLNHTGAPVSYFVAFPLPLLDASVPEETNFVLPNENSDNFVDFAVTVDGEAVTPAIDQHATALGVDRTAEIGRRGLPLNPAAPSLYEKLKTMPKDDIAAMNQLGLVLVDPDNVQAAWKLATTFYWPQTFPPGREIVVQHRYRPVIGFSFFGKENLKLGYYRTTYCADSAFLQAAAKRLTPIANSSMPYLDEQRISYILTTANNWAAPIKSFHLTVDKGDPDALVSFCGTNVRKTGATTFEINATDFVPEKELEILIVKPHKDQ